LPVPCCCQLYVWAPPNMDLTHQIQDILCRGGNYIHGRDADDDTGETYASIIEWKEEIGMTLLSGECGNKQRQNETRQQWYTTGYNYWENVVNCPATIDGVLGGFASLSKRDLEGSADFMRYLKSTIRPELKLTQEDNGGIPTRACECGAGKLYFGITA
jgi:hypothetical protein